MNLWLTLPGVFRCGMGRVLGLWLGLTLALIAIALVLLAKWAKEAKRLNLNLRPETLN